MKYVRFRPTVVTTASEQLEDARPRRRASGSRRAGATGWTDEKVQTFQAASSWRYVIPSTVRVPPAAPTRDDADAVLHLLHVGFSLSLPEQCRLSWVRFVVEGSAVQDAPPVRFVSLFPAAVYREVGFAGPIVVGDDGVLKRETNKADGPGADEVRFTPMLFGFVAAAQSACWDFTPLDGQPPVASDQLVLAISKPPEHAFVPRQQLFVYVVHPEHGETLLELPASTVPDRIRG